MNVMDMFPSWSTMIAIDCVVIVSAVLLTLLFFINREKIMKSGAGMGVGLIVVGFWMIGLLYIYDLFTMLLLPDLSGKELAMREMIRLHVRYSWYVHLAGMVCIVAGVTISIFAVVRQLETVREAHARAETASSAKSIFLANMSHELRTPLNAILGFSDLISNGLVSDRPDKCEEYAQDIHASGEHLLNLVQDLLDLARIEAGRMNFHLEDINVTELVEEIVALMRGEAEKRELAVSCDVDDVLSAIKGDRRAVKQVILNLLSNAYKHTPAGGAVKVESVRLAGGVISIAVIDDGPGIPGEVMDNLFMPYSSSDVANQSGERGNGLGLALSKQLIEAQGGTIAIASSPGQGTIATITLPAAGSAAREAA